METKLSCDVRNCVNNISGLCDAYMINIIGSNARENSSTECETFADKNILNMAKSRFINSNLDGEFKQIFTNESIEMSPKIKCEAKNCVHNANGDCSAANIQIHESRTKDGNLSQCQTFKSYKQFNNVLD
ncbi:DUF1540 domain-containing protein [Clostridium fermenticellae]|uniref:DUF1540 domain-containing protein n=1 Tax=Clostridium fermenticellae TaxID=2068654 RepID=A0A386H187_9CLOT|nr:DUF1540 domain-containing protein [Clostridium fermenticellae]AYD39416.1 DUF1540 domain-containing protein [Clostridium fermenticellae]